MFLYELNKSFETYRDDSQLPSYCLRRREIKKSVFCVKTKIYLLENNSLIKKVLDILKIELFNKLTKIQICKLDHKIKKKVN